MKKKEKNPLFLAIQATSILKIEKSLLNGSSLKDRDNQGRTPLIAAACQIENSEKLISFLIHQGADVNEKCKNFKATALEHAVTGKPPLINSALLLIEAGTKLDKLKYEDDSLTIGEYLLEFCVNKKELFPVLKALLSKGVKPKELTKYSEDCFSFLEMALRNMHSDSDLEVLKYLLDLGLDPNMKNTRGATPLHIAVWMSTIKGAEMLLNYGADPYLKNNLEESPFDRALSNSKTTSSKSMVFFSWFAAYLEKKQLLESVPCSKVTKKKINL